MSSFDSKRGPPEIEGMTSLKVDNLTYRTTIGDLEHVFSKYGELGDVYIPRDRYKQESRGFAFVRFYERRDAEDAMDALHGKVIDGREIRVQMAKYGRPTDPYKPRNNRYRSSYVSSSRYRSRSRSPKRRWRFYFSSLSLRYFTEYPVTSTSIAWYPFNKFNYLLPF